MKNQLFVSRVAPIGLLVSLGACLFFAFGGIRYGLPDDDHILTYNCDETQWLEAFTYIQPSKGRWSRQPLLHRPAGYFLLYGAGIAAPGAVGWLPLGADKTWCGEHPEIFGLFFLVGRFLQVESVIQANRLFAR